MHSLDKSWKKRQKRLSCSTSLVLFPLVLGRMTSCRHLCWLDAMVILCWDTQRKKKGSCSLLRLTDPPWLCSLWVCLAQCLVLTWRAGKTEQKTQISICLSKATPCRAHASCTGGEPGHQTGPTISDKVEFALKEQHPPNCLRDNP